MGNRAVIKFGGTSQGIYLHWNGGVESVQAFLDCAKRYDLRGGSYGAARLCQIIGNFFGGSLSLGVDNVKFLDCDNQDNGMFIVDEHWNIDKREYVPEHVSVEKFDSAYYLGVFDECCKANDAVFKYSDVIKAAA
jgi:hypothetical protein